MEIQKQNMQIDLRLSLIDARNAFIGWRTERGFAAVLEGNAVWLRPGDAFEDVRLRRYLDLDRDYDAIAREYEEFPRRAKGVRCLPGPAGAQSAAWETLFSFILSANNNVVRIRSLVYCHFPRLRGGGGRPVRHSGPGSDCRPRLRDELRALGRGLPRALSGGNGPRRVRRFCLGRAAGHAL